MMMTILSIHCLLGDNIFNISTNYPIFITIKRIFHLSWSSYSAIHYHTPYSKLMKLKHIIASPQSSILRQPNFVTSRFMIKTFNIFTQSFFLSNSTMVWPSFHEWLFFWIVNSLDCIVCECLHSNFSINLSTERVTYSKYVFVRYRQVPFFFYS